MPMRARRIIVGTARHCRRQAHQGSNGEPFAAMGTMAEPKLEGVGKRSNKGYRTVYYMACSL